MRNQFVHWQGVLCLDLKRERILQQNGRNRAIKSHQQSRHLVLEKVKKSIFKNTSKKPKND